MELEIKNRSFHVISGRLRMELYGLKNNPETGQKFEEFFSAIDGIQLIKTNSITGKILLHFDENMIPLNELCYLISKFEETLIRQVFGIPVIDEENDEIDDESEEDISQYVAAASEIPQSNAFMTKRQQVVGSMLGYVPKSKWARAPDENPVPIPLALSVTGLGVLGIKQLLFGRSILARHPIPFYIAAALSVGTGYSFIKKRLKNLSKKNRWLNVDLLLTASALTLALIRENLIVLASLSLLQYLNWKSSKSVDQVLMDQEFVSEEIEAYSRRSSKMGFIGAAVAFAVTRNPLVSLGILLAANPRPILASTEYAWKQAEHSAKEHKQAIPKNGSVHQLSKTKYVVFKSDSLLFENGTIRKQFVSILDCFRGLTFSFVQKDAISDYASIQKELNHYGVKYASYQDIQINDREEVLVVVKDTGTMKNKVTSFYPSCTVSQLNRIATTLKNGKDLRKVIKRNMFLTRIWNVVGSVMAVPMMISAPLINLIGDALSLSFIAKAKQWTEKRFSPTRDYLTNAMETKDKIPWHTKNKEEILQIYQVEAYNGLSELQVKQAVQQYGKNQLVSKTRPHWMKTYFGQFKEFTTQVLAATALLSAFTGHLFDGLIMGSILLLNAGIGTFQERKAGRAVETMSQFVPPSCRVVRDGKLKEIEADSIVPGDIVELESGDRIPADLRILQAWNLEVNESALTGESLPVEKKEEIVNAQTPISDRTNMLYMGTHVTRGKCQAIVVQTGKNTEMGDLLALLSEDDDHSTPLQNQVTKISKKFMKGALAVGAVVFITGLLRGIPITEMITTSVALTASAIPEGLPITITIALTAGIFRMANKQALVRKLSAIETLGRTTVICSDKTGTLTKNEMTVKKVVTLNHELEATGDGYNLDGMIVGLDEGTSKDVDQLISIALHCNDAELYQEDGHWNVKGDPTEGALLTLAAKRGKLKENYKHWKRAGEIPFDSISGKMSVVCHEGEKEDQCYVMSKGSVEKLLRHCTHYQSNGKRYPLTEEIRQHLMAKNDSLAHQALRVLGFAYRELGCFNGDMENVDQGLIFVGMVGMIDPPKPEVEKSIAEAIRLGIKPVIITGDHPLTACAIAKQIGIYDDQKKAVTGQELDLLSDEELKSIIEDVAIFARVTPEHKLRIVKVFQEKGHIVAMTGDGVNDSPAIKKADVGIAMGRTGTQVTKESADMVLKEDHFGSIVDGVKEGRTIIGNIRKAIGCLLSGNLAEILVSAVAVMAGMPLPIIPVQILLMNMLTDALPAMVLAINPGKKMKETNRQEIIDGQLYKQVITRGAVLGAGSLGLFTWALGMGLPLATARTVAFASLVSGQLVQTFSWRQQGSEESLHDLKKDRFLIGALGVSWLSLLSVIYIPALSGIFKTAPLPLGLWIPILLVAMASALVAKPLLKSWISRNSVSQASLSAA